MIPPRCSAIVPVRNSKRFLEPVVESILRALQECPGELILVDNGSTDGSYEMMVERWGAKARVYSLPGPTISGVRNFGAREARSDVLCFIDSDCVVPPGYFVEVLDVLARIDADATGSPYVLPDRPHWVEEAWHELHHGAEVERDVVYLNGGNFICRRAAFEAVGGFDEQLVTGEDAELGQRLVGKGFRIRQVPSIVAVHLGNPKSLGAFYRKQRWHGLGMFGTFRQNWLDRPVIMMFAHLLAQLAAVAVLARAVVSGGGVPGFLPALVTVALLLGVPAITVIYRAREGGWPRHPLRGVLLYHLYFDARIAGLFQITRDRLRGR